MMSVRIASITVLGLLIASLAVARVQDEPSKLPIAVPQKAFVNFEAEGPGKQFLKTIKHLMAGDMVDPTAPPADNITIKTSLGNVDFKIDDLAPLLEKIHMLHVVSYTALPNEDPFKRHEAEFEAAGLKRIAFAPGANGMLITRHIGTFDSYGIVSRQKDQVVVLRTEGAPGLGDLGKVIFEALSKSVQKAVAAKHH